MKNKLNLILSLVCIFLVCLALPKLIGNQRGKNVKTQDSALLNTKYLSKINKITLGDSVETLLFSKNGEYWLGNYGDLTFYADNKMISELISNFSKTRTLIKVASDFKSHATYELNEEQAFNVAFYNEDMAGNKTEFSSIYFGIENSDRTMIYLRNNRNPNVYSMQNDLYSYFNTRLENFGIMELFPINDVSEKNIETVEIVDFSEDKKNIKIKKNGDSDFSDIVHKLFSLRGASFFSEDILEKINMKLIKRISIKTSQNDFYNLEVFSYTNSVNNEQFFVKTDFSRKDNSVNYVLEISSWTKSRLDF